MAIANVDKERFFVNLVKTKKLLLNKKGWVFNVITNREIGFINSKGYKVISYYNKNSNRVLTIQVHRLVWLIYKDKHLDPYLQINHIDSNRANPSLSNLEVVTGSQNCIHGYKYGWRNPLKGEEKPNSEFSDDEVIKYRKNYKQGNTTIELIALTKNCHYLTVKQMLSGKTYSHLRGATEVKSQGRLATNRKIKEKINTIAPWYKKGYSSYTIADITGISRATVCRLINKNLKPVDKTKITK